MTTITEDELASRRARNEANAQAGERWLEKMRAEIDRLPFGTVVIFDVETGVYVTGATHIEAMDEFDRKIGEHRPGFVHEAGRRVILGGGIIG